MKVEAPFIHLIKLHTKYYLYDVNSKMIVNISNDLFDFFKSNENIKAEIEIPHKLEDEVRRLLKYDLFSKTDTGYEIEYPQGTNLEEILNNCMRIMTLQVTQNCNLRCKYCVYSGSYSNRVHSNKRMSFETAKSAIDFLYAHSSMTTSIGIGFYGGEPLLEFDLLKKCVEYAKMKFIGKDLSFTLTTNATLLTEEIMKFFVKNNFFVTISFDGPQVIQDKNRVMADGKSGSFETVMKNVEMFLNKYPDFSWHVSFNAVLDPTNDFSCSNDFFMNFETVKSITANGVLVSTDGLKKELEKDETFSIAYEYEMFKNFLCSCGKLDKIGSKLSVAYIEQLEKLVAKREVGIEKNKKFAHPGGPCLIGVHKFFVNADGNFYPCERVDESANVTKIGNIKSGFDFDRIRELLNIGKLTENECKNCCNYYMVSHIARLVNEGFFENGGSVRAVPVTIGGSSYVPPIPNELDAKEKIDEIINSGLEDVDIAIELTLYCMKTQIFIDGNKRASIIFANHFMIGKGIGLLVVPENIVSEFKSLLVAYYEGRNEDEIKAFLKEKCWRKF